MPRSHHPPSRKKRYVLVGTGGRSVMFLDPIASAHRETAELAGLCDLNPTRLAFHQERLKAKFGLAGVPAYPAEDFDRMLAEQAPDTVIVCTVDALHDEYIVRALDAGCDVITEKPMTTDAAKCRRILEAVERTGRPVRVTFNMRWMPGASKVKELIAGGAIGQVKNVLLEYRLDTSHGADYFRRWHSEKSRSGGLLVHKSTHHFDLVNWWIDAIPETVFAFGDLAFYGRENAVARGREAWTRYERYTGQAPDSDPFKLDMTADPSLKGLYLEAEKDDGYVRDRNVFRAGIDIEDSLGVLVRYRNGALLTYSLTAFCPQEGFRVTINGDGGQIEFEKHISSHIIRGQDDRELARDQDEQSGQRLTVRPLFGPSYEVEIPDVPGGHGGGDPLLQEQMFGVPKPDEILRRDAGHEQGAASAAIGFAANQAMRDGMPVRISELLRLRPQAVNLSELA